MSQAHNLSNNPGTNESHYLPYTSKEPKYKYKDKLRQDTSKWPPKSQMAL